MESHARILLIGDDDDLRLSRDLILQKDGYEVESISSNLALKIAPGERYQVAIIGQCVGSARAIRLAACIRERLPEVRILRIEESRCCLENVYDLCCEVLCPPVAFLAAVRTLCDGELRKAHD